MGSHTNSGLKLKRGLRTVDGWVVRYVGSFMMNGSYFGGLVIWHHCVNIAASGIDYCALVRSLLLTFILGF